MKHKVTIPKPCAENWDTMSSAERGRHCAVCDKVVHDLTDFTKPDLYKFLEENKGVCGRVPVKLLDIPTVKERSSYAATIALATVLSVSAVTAQNNEREVGIRVSTERIRMGEVAVNPSFDEFLQERQVIIKGKVVDANDELGLPGAKIFLLSHPERDLTVHADFNGEFEFRVPSDIPLEEVVLQFSFLGYGEQSIQLREEELYIELKLEEDLIGEVEYFTTGKTKVKKEKKNKRKDKR